MATMFYLREVVRKNKNDTVVRIMRVLNLTESLERSCRRTLGHLGGTGEI